MFLLLLPRKSTITYITLRILFNSLRMSFRI
jgi:hypothetical protein